MHLRLRLGRYVIFQHFKMMFKHEKNIQIGPKTVSESVFSHFFHQNFEILNIGANCYISSTMAQYQNDPKSVAEIIEL